MSPMNATMSDVPASATIRNIIEPSGVVEVRIHPREPTGEQFELSPGVVMLFVLVGDEEHPTGREQCGRTVAESGKYSSQTKTETAN